MDPHPQRGRLRLGKMPTKIKQQPASRKANQAKRNTRRPKSSAPANNISKVISSKLTHQVCGLSDPFCAHASGAKYPDDSSTRTLPFSRRGRHVLTTDGSGNAAYLFNPQYTRDPITFPSARTGAAVTAWTDFPAYTGVIAGVDKYRIVSCGFTIKSITAPLSASGELNMRSFGNDVSTLTSLDMLTYNATANLNMPIRTVDNVAVVLSHDAEMPQHYYSVSTDSAATASCVTRGFNPVTIYISGAPVSTNVLVVEFIINYELVFSDESGMAMVSTVSPPANTVLTTAAAKVTSALPTFFERGVTVAANAITNRAASAIASYFGGPAGATAYALARVVD